MRRVLSLLLTVAMMLSLVVVAGAAESGKVDLVIEPKATYTANVVQFDVKLVPQNVTEIGAFQFTLTAQNCTIDRVVYLNNGEDGTQSGGLQFYKEKVGAEDFVNGYFEKFGGEITSNKTVYKFLAAGTARSEYTYGGKTYPAHIWTNPTETLILTLQVTMNDGAKNCSLAVDTTAGSSGRFTVGQSVDVGNGKYEVKDACTGVATSNEYSTGASYEITPVGKGANIPTCTLEGTNLTVTYSLPCAVAYSTDGGATYTRISATSASDGSYVYDLSAVPANAKIIVVVKGDVNGDGKVNSKDVTRLRQNIKSPATYPLDEGMTEAANVNGDSKVNGKDVTRLRQYIKSPNSYPLG